MWPVRGEKKIESEPLYVSNQNFTLETSGDLSESKSVIPDSLQDHLSHTFLSVTIKRRKNKKQKTNTQDLAGIKIKNCLC